METENVKKPLWLTILHWGARITALLLIIFICGYTLSLFSSENKMVLSMILLYSEENFYLGLILGIPFIIGLLIGLKWEGLGGLISLVFMTIIFLTLAGFYDILHYLLLLPSILYILSWFFHRRWARQQFN